MLYIPRAWQKTLADLGLDSCQGWLDHQLELVDEPNHGHGGYSEVGYIGLDRESNSAGLYVKRQRNYSMRTWRHPLKGVPSFRQEFDNIRRLDSYGIKTIEVVCYAETKTRRGREAVLVTEALADYVSMDRLNEGEYGEADYSALVEQIATAVLALHATGYRHPCLYPKHIFIGCGEVRFIDLETVRPHHGFSRLWRKDLEVLLRRSSQRFRQHRRLFVETYLGAGATAEEVDKLLALLDRRAAKKAKR
ncbi:lipopolysaccharide kinase (Kdo/WaaP) family protein [Sinobacterium caligoides]|uniref:Lipopolysaccharide kinase (Kdo/WaaP) family protein n=1 Tax=Sinobacterium caligoides TaxID=933926 RepID=A0A3N2DGQ1_9GAMM|nr:lipopolysaccharide kinase InaA family protein [Sinobacterium caligoides]ROR98828.1 lipopolysaccharide kinase (Kdo/WaaP) family protein [Sinobacterium caligoides]